MAAFVSFPFLIFFLVCLFCSLFAMWNIDICICETGMEFLNPFFIISMMARCGSETINCFVGIPQLGAVSQH